LYEAQLDEAGLRNTEEPATLEEQDKTIGIVNSSLIAAK
jgi:hypothetical protein